MYAQTVPFQFIGELIEVHFDKLPGLEKKPTCPQSFIWREETFQIEEMLEEWVDFERKGHMARNMVPAHLSRASRAGSWGVGRFCFRVRVTGGRIFEIYYDRSPKTASDRKGHWFLMGERRSVTSPSND